MKRRLFWKILFAFWLTFLAITQAVWLLFELNRGERGPPGEFASAQIALASAAEIVSRSGPTGFEAMLERLPESFNERLVLTPVLPTSKFAPETQGKLTSAAVVEAPNGSFYRVSYLGPPITGPMILLNTPPELLLLGLVGGLLFSAALAWYLTEPINRLRAGFDRLARGDLDVRLGPAIGRRRDEIANLGRDFDNMAQRLEQLVAARDRLLNDVSHELRSPLARLQLSIGLARQVQTPIAVTLDRIEREVQRLDALVDELLTLARAEHFQLLNEDYFDLAGVVASVVEDARFEAQDSGIEIRLEESVPAEDKRSALRGNAELIRRAIDNIVRNALRFSRSGERIDVCINYNDTSRTYRVSVADQGPGVPIDDLDTLFDPFVRGEDCGAGFGLGLAIASRAMLAHGGSISAQNGSERGFTVIMSLPAATTIH